MNVSVPKLLRDHYDSGRVILFIGAGSSMSVKWQDADGNAKRGPSWEELVNYAIKKMDFSDPRLLRARGTDLQILEYFKIRNNGQFAKLTNWFYSEMRAPDQALLDSPILTQCSLLEKCSVFYTTNFDDFLERSLVLNGAECQPIAVEADMAARATQAAKQVVKFHGDWNYPEMMVLSESDYERRLSLTTAMDHRLRADMLGHVLLFIGYSFRDWNVAYLFRLINDQFKGQTGAMAGRRAYIVVADPSDFEQRLFEERNIEVIPVSGKTVTTDVAAVLEQIRT